jgi:hypothetical protein
LSRISPDDTPVLDRDDPRAVCKGRIWTYLGDYDQIGFCEYTKIWEGEARARSCGRRNDALGGARIRRARCAGERDLRRRHRDARDAPSRGRPSSLVQQMVA